MGDILGAGIYALVGKVAGQAGGATWLAFGAATGVAILTALSYAELGSRFPKSGGAATFCREAFGTEWAPLFIGWLVLCSGMVSMATVSHGFAGYLGRFLPGLPLPVVVAAFLSLLGLINLRGIRESSGANILCTAVELSGLLVVVAAGAWFLLRAGAPPALEPFPRAVPVPSILQGAALAFFALIGFEDMVNVAEEAREPEKNLPRAILAAVAVAGGLYMLVCFVALRVVPAVELAGSPTPLLNVVQRAAPAVPPALFSAVALFAVSNTALLNFVMGSRLVYGMAQEGLLPRPLGKLHPSRSTPHVAIGVILLATVALALSGTLTRLAGTTSGLLLAVFVAVHAALLRVKGRRESRPVPFAIPAFVPVLGICSCLGLMVYLPAGSLRGALLLAGIGGVMVLARGLALRHQA